MVTVIKRGTPKEEIRKQLKKALSKDSNGGIMQYAGKLKADIDPVEFQRMLRDEWQ